jgi:phage-related tail fiber protein
MNYVMKLTALGAAKIAAATAGTADVVLTHIAVGDGLGNEVAAATGIETKLVREVYRTQINSLGVNTNDATLMLAEMLIPSNVGGFAIHEVGVFDADGDLFAYANFPATWKPVPSDGSSREMVVQAAMKVSNSAVINLLVDGNLVLATRQWVLATITPGYLFPGGSTGQVLTKISNANGHVRWANATDVNVTVNSIEELQTLTAGQTVVDWAVVNHAGLAIYVEGVRLRANQWTKHASLPARITLAQSYAAGTKIVGTQNEPAGSAPDPLVKAQNLADMPDKGAGRSNLGVYSKAETDQKAPAGAVVHFARSTAPAGWLKANGAAVSRTIYADLFAAIGMTFGAGDGANTFNLPDLRGEFIRGWDDARGIDAGRAFGSAQADANKAHDHTGTASSAGSHSHSASTGGAGSSNSTWVAGRSNDSTTATNNVATLGSHTHTVTVNSAGSHSHSLSINDNGGPEARPRNVALLACIKF